MRIALLTLLCAQLGGCLALAVTGAVVGAGVTAVSLGVKGGVAVGKGAVSVATYPFRDSDEEKAAKEKAKTEAKAEAEVLERALGAI